MRTWNILAILCTIQGVPWTSLPLILTEQNMVDWHNWLLMLILTGSTMKLQTTFMCHVEQLLLQLAPLGSFDATMGNAFPAIGNVMDGMIALTIPMKPIVPALHLNSNATMDAAFQLLGSVMNGTIAMIIPTKVTVEHKIHQYRQEEVEEEDAFLQKPLLKL